jgi:hypothetical protein
VTKKDEMGESCRRHDMKIVYTVLVRKPETRDHLEDLDSKNNLECILGKFCVKMWAGCFWLG